MQDDKIEVRNITSPDHITRVDRARYAAMKSALLAALPGGPPGLTGAEMKQALRPHLDAALFPGGAKAGWWMKCVQLDLEFQGLVRRIDSRPLRFHRTA